jgi:hypothetical protein
MPVAAPHMQSTAASAFSSHWSFGAYPPTKSAKPFNQVRGEWIGTPVEPSLGLPPGARPCHPGCKLIGRLKQTASPTDGQPGPSQANSRRMERQQGAFLPLKKPGPEEGRATIVQNVPRRHSRRSRSDNVTPRRLQTSHQRGGVFDRPAKAADSPYHAPVRRRGDRRRCPEPGRRSVSPVRRRPETRRAYPDHPSVFRSSVKSRLSEYLSSYRSSPHCNPRHANPAGRARPFRARQPHRLTTPIFTRPRSRRMLAGHPTPATANLTSESASRHL